MMFKILLFLFFVDDTLQCSFFSRPQCTSDPSCQYCLCSELDKKFESTSGQYACNGNKCLATTQILFVKVCSTCVQGYKVSGEHFCELDLSTPTSQCQIGEYDDNGTCINCLQNCLQCTSLIDCNYCTEGYYFLSSQQICAQCSQNCLQCSIQQDNCTECSSDRELDGSNSCLCKTGYYEQNNQCMQCLLPCIKCTSNYVCSECVTIPFIYLNSDYSCQCQVGYYYQYLNQNCELCELTCKTCTSTSNNCLSCYVQQNRILENNQCVCQDNYFENQLKQCISCQSEEALKIQKCNYANCNDNVWSYGEQCDDGNQQIRDGCFNCQIEQSFYCINLISQPSQCFRCPENCVNCQYQNNKIICTNVIDGYFINALNDIQKCNEKCKSCINQASNCLECKYISIKNQCQFCEYKEGYYTDFENIQCYTKCGDGLVADIEQCDDGNEQNGDGCNNQCQLEKLYDCKNGICIKQDVPYPIAQSNKTYGLFNQIRQVLVQYNQLLNLSEKFNISDHIVVQVVDQNSNQIQSSINITQNLKWNSSNGSNLTFIVECHFNESHDRIQLQIHYSNPIQIKNVQNIYQEIQLIKIRIDDIRITTSNIEIITEGAITSTNYFLYYLSGLLICALLFGGLEIYYNLLDTIQIFSYLYYINVQFPYNLDQFFQNLNFAQFTFFQDFFNLQQIYSNLFSINIGDIQQNVYLPQKLQNQGYSSFFIINFASIFCVFAVSISIYILSKLHYKYFLNEIIRDNIIGFDNKYVKLFKKFKGFVKKYIRNQVKTIQAEYLFSGILRIFMASANEFSFSLQIAIKGLSLKNTFEIFNSISTLLFILIYFFTAFVSIIMIEQKTYQVKNYIFQIKYGSLFEGLALKKYTFIVNPMMIIKKFFFMLILIQLYDFSIYQVFYIFLLGVFYLTYLLMFSPFEESLELKKNILCECQQTISLLLFLILSINEKLLLINYNQQLIIGWLIISSILIALAIQVIIDSIQQFKLMYQKHKFFKQFCDNLTNLVAKEKNKASPHVFME